MKKPKFDSYNDGVIEFGNYIENYDEYGNALDRKEFISDGKLFFSYKSIREEDKLKYDNTGFKVSIKLKTRYFEYLNSSHTVRLNGNLYSIINIDPDSKKENMYIYLTNLVNELDKHICIYKKRKNGMMEDDSWNLYKTVWSKVYSSTYKSDKESIKADKLTAGIFKNFVVRYLKELDLSIDNQATVDYKIQYKNKFYNILQISNTDELDELLDIYTEGE